MDRRDLLHGAATLAGWGFSAAVLGRAPELLAQPALGPAQPFDWERLKAQARELATQPFEPPGDQRPPQLAELTWDQYEALRFRPDHALWADTDLPVPGPVLPSRQLLPGGGADLRRRQRRGAADRVRPQPVRLRPDQFDPPLPHDLGFAGWRLHFHTNFPQDIAVFLGASYFRATDAGDQYGISCRGLADRHRA